MSAVSDVPGRHFFLEHNQSDILAHEKAQKYLR